MRYAVNGKIKIELPCREYKRNERYVIFGIGEVGNEIYRKLMQKVSREQIAYFIDSAYPENKYDGISVYRLDDLENVNDYKFLLGTLTNTETMKRLLKGKGVDEKNILVCTDIFSEEKMLNSDGDIKSVCVYPSINTCEEYDNIIRKLRWYLGKEINKLEIDFICDEAVRGVKEKEKSINKIEESEICKKRYDMMLVWNYEKYEQNESLMVRETYCIDGEFFSIIDLRMLLALRYRLEDEQEKKSMLRISKENFSRMIGKYEVAYVVGVGPTLDVGLEMYAKRKNKNDLKIVCNSTIYKDEVMKKLQPNVYVISDEAWMSEELAGAFGMIVEYVKDNDCVLCLPKQWISIVMERYRVQQLEHKLIGIGIDAPEICFPSEEKLSVYRKAGNIITRFSIPIASSLCNIVYFMGCDGREPDKKNGEVWEYSSELRSKADRVYTVGTKKTVLGDLLNDDYYLVRHYSYMEELLKYGEKKKKKYESITDSYIPALKKRRKD